MASGVDAKLLRSTKFPPEFNQKVDMQKVNIQVMKKWVAGRISEILGSEDDVVIELCFNLIESTRFPDIKSLQIQLTGFLEKDTAAFCKELWNLCLSAVTSPQGIPRELLEAKKMELIQEKLEAEQAAEESRKRRDAMDRRDRGGRGGGRADSWRGGGGGGGGGGRRDDREFDNRRGGFGRGRDRSRSPAPRSRDYGGGDSYRGSRRDIYVPRGPRGGGMRQNNRRGRAPTRSPSADSKSSRSRSGSSSHVDSRKSDRVHSPPRRRQSPGKRRRSPSPKPESHRARRSPSPAARPRRSPPSKRRRYSPSRSRSRDRRRRSPSSSASESSRYTRSRSRSPARKSSRRSRSRSLSSEDSRKGRRSGGKRSRSRSRSLTRSLSSSSGDDRHVRRRRSRSKDTKRRGRGSPSGKAKQNTSSVSSLSRSRSRDIAADSGREGRNQPSHTEASSSDALKAHNDEQDPVTTVTELAS